MEASVTVRLVAKQQDDGLVPCLETIRFTDQETTFLFPTELRFPDHHTPLFNLPTVKKACKGMKKPGHYRNVNLVLKEPLLQNYIDEARNFIFEDTLLEEKHISFSGGDNVSSDLSHELIDILGNLRLTNNLNEPKWNEIEKRFAIEKFSGREKAAEWLCSFETECSRHKVKDDHQKIKCLKLFLADTALDWYKSNSIKLKEETWSAWSASFLTVYLDRGWSQIRHAYNFKYLAGSYVDFALRKERLILEVESRTSQYATINQIVIGLPISIQEKLDRQEMNTTDDLISKLRQYDSNFAKNPMKPEKSGGATVTPKVKPEETRHYDRDSVRAVDRKP